MPARIYYSSAPYEDHRFPAVLRPLLLISNLLAAAWIYPCRKTARISWTPELGSLLELLRNRTRPVIFYSWHAYEPLLIVAFRGFPDDLVPLGIGHDGWPSLAFHRAVAWFGIPVWVYRRKSSVPPRQQLIDFISASPDKRIVGLITDAGGPYGEAKGGLLDVARATKALLVPIAVRSRPVLFSRLPRRYAWPLPFARLEPHYGEPVDGSTATLDQCEKALMDVDRLAHGVWSS